jgi:hypothetical protein
MTARSASIPLMRKKLDAATQSSPDSVRGGFFYVLREGKAAGKVSVWYNESTLYKDFWFPGGLSILKRNLVIDNLRGLAMLGVIGIHIGTFVLSSSTPGLGLFLLLQIFTRFCRTGLFLYFRLRPLLQRCFEQAAGLRGIGAAPSADCRRALSGMVAVLHLAVAMGGYDPAGRDLFAIGSLCEASSGRRMLPHLFSGHPAGILPHSPVVALARTAHRPAVPGGNGRLPGRPGGAAALAVPLECRLLDVSVLDGAVQDYPPAAERTHQLHPLVLRVCLCPGRVVRHS